MPVVKTRDENGNYIILDMNTGRRQTTQPVQQSTSVQKPSKWRPKRLTKQQKDNIKQREMYEIVAKNQDQLYDKDMLDEYNRKQSFYNNNAFGYGISGQQTRFDPRTEAGRQAIDQNLEYARGNAVDFLSNLVLGGAGAAMHGVTPRFSRNLGKLDDYMPWKIGEGSESVVYSNNPFTVGKIGTVDAADVAMRNKVPNTVQSRYVGNVDAEWGKVPVTIQQKVRPIKAEDYGKYIKQLDEAMHKKGWRPFIYDKQQYRAYTNGRMVADDISPDNIGLDWLGRPKIIDFNPFRKEVWMEYFAY